MADKTRDNPKAFQELNQRLEQLAGVQSKVGWFESAVYPGGRPVAAVAAGNELGIPGRSIPARPFFRPTAAEKSKEWAEHAASLANRVLAGKMSAFEAMDTLAGLAEDDVLKTILAISSPPLSPITLGARKYRREGKTVTGATIGEIARKLKDGTLDITGVPDKPLDDTHHMIDTLTHATEESK
jgi:hypothetical protein